MPPHSAAPVPQPSASAPNHEPHLHQQPGPPLQLGLGPVPQLPLPTPIRTPSLTIGTSLFVPQAQKFIILAMCFFSYTAEQVAKCLGMRDDGSLEKSPQDVEAAAQFFAGHWGLLSDRKQWELDEARYRHWVERRFEMAASEQTRRQAIARENAIEARITRARWVSEWMDDMMEHEQRYFHRQWQKSQGVQFTSHDDHWREWL